jgi:hypothetical protein
MQKGFFNYAASTALEVLPAAQRVEIGVLDHVAAFRSPPARPGVATHRTVSVP